MNLSTYISVIDANTVVHIIDEKENKTLCFGTIRNVYSDLTEEVLKTKEVLRVYLGFGGLCIEVV